MRRQHAAAAGLQDRRPRTAVALTEIQHGEVRYLNRLDAFLRKAILSSVLLPTRAVYREICSLWPLRAMNNAQADENGWMDGWNADHVSNGPCSDDQSFKRMMPVK